MSASSFDEIRRRYNFKELKVAQWRDPTLSVHHTRGGPAPVSVSPDAIAESMAKPTFTYKVRIARPPEPTDDEESEDEEEVEEKEEEEESKTERE